MLEIIGNIFESTELILFTITMMVSIMIIGFGVIWAVNDLFGESKLTKKIDSLIYTLEHFLVPKVYILIITMMTVGIIGICLYILCYAISYSIRLF